MEMLNGVRQLTPVFPAIGKYPGNADGSNGIQPVRRSSSSDFSYGCAVYLGQAEQSFPQAASILSIFDLH